MDTRADTPRKIDWHAGFAGGLGYFFREYQDRIEVQREFNLTKQSPRIDFLLIKKDPGAASGNAVGDTFRRYNILEYKSPDAPLDIDVIWKCIGYAGLFKGLAKTVDEVPAEELTVSIFRARRPDALFARLREEGSLVEETSPGLYRIRGLVALSLHIVITRELEGDVFRTFRVMMPDAPEEDVRAFLLEAEALQDRGTKLWQNVGAVLQVSAAANRSLFEKLRKETQMGDVLKEIMHEEIEAGYAKGRAEGLSQGRANGLSEGRERERLASIRSLMDTLKLSAQDAMDALKISVQDQKRYLTML